MRRRLCCRPDGVVALVAMASLPLPMRRRLAVGNNNGDSATGDNDDNNVDNDGATGDNVDNDNNDATDNNVDDNSDGATEDDIDYNCNGATDGRHRLDGCGGCTTKGDAR